MKTNFKRKHKNVLATAVILSMALAATGCGTSAPTETASLAAGSVLLSMNPEIEIEYDKDGLVLELEGINDDGRGIAANYKDFAGKPTAEVIGKLVEDMHKAGYFDKKVGGKEKNIVLKLGEGSQYSDDFLLEMEDAVRQTVGALGLKSAPMTVDKDDLDDKGRINQETAKKLLLHQLHLKSAEFTDYEFELDDGVYELEFTVDGVEYEFEVNAVNGKVLEADMERNDDWKRIPSTAKKVAFYDDDWDDWDDDDRYDDDWDDDDRYDDDWDDDRYEDDDDDEWDD
ncbi:PepSY domain-containing protein [Anaerotignum sp.]